MVSLMVWGTSGSVGKSLLTTGLCRALECRGWRVLPFKSIAVSRDLVPQGEGLVVDRGVMEMAEACRQQLAVEMNPIMIHPRDRRVECDLLNNDYNADVYIFGRYEATLRIGELITIVPELRSYLEKAYRSLAKNCEIVLLEGSGSPVDGGELGRLANEEMSQIAEAACFLVTGCKKGAAISSALGVHHMLGEGAQRIRGLVLNQQIGRFIDEDGMRAWQSTTGIPVIGEISHYALDLGGELPDALQREVADIKREAERNPERGRRRTDRWYDLLAKNITSGLDVERMLTLCLQ